MDSIRDQTWINNGVESCHIVGEAVAIGTVGTIVEMLVESRHYLCSSRPTTQTDFHSCPFPDRLLKLSTPMLQKLGIHEE